MPETTPINGRVLQMSALAMGIAVAAGFVARALTALIGVITNLAFYGRLSADFTSPAGNHLGWLVVLVPVAGGVVVGLMARYGSSAIRGHGIPEAMEHVLLKESRIPARVTVLKPLSAAIAIGTGGPFGAEGPIIATGGALGSLVGQLLKTTAEERKVLLAAGAAAGMSATFGSPVSAVLLAVELLLFEFSAKSLIPVALAAAVAAAVRAAFAGVKPIFAMPGLSPAGGGAIASYIVLGAVVGVAAVYATKIVYAVEDAFERLPLHWMWWPALGGVAVGAIGLFAPRTLGVGYDNIEMILTGSFAGKALVALCLFKFLSWSVSLGSGTSGGTLAPLLTIGGGLGGALGSGLAVLIPQAGVDPRMAALVGMAALFTGASRAFLTSVVFAFETTMQPAGLLPLLGGCAAAHLVSCWMMRHSIMTEKIARRGVRVPAEYSADLMSRVHVREVLSGEVVALKAAETVEAARRWLDSGKPGSQFHGFPVLDEAGLLVGVLTRRDIAADGRDFAAPLSRLVKRPPVAVFEGDSLREAIDLMLGHDVGRLPVLAAAAPHKVVGMLTRSAVLSAYRRHFDEARNARRGIDLGLASLRRSLGRGAAKPTLRP